MLLVIGIQSNDALKDFKPKCLGSLRKRTKLMKNQKDSFQPCPSTKLVKSATKNSMTMQSTSRVGSTRGKFLWPLELNTFVKPSTNIKWLFLTKTTKRIWLYWPKCVFLWTRQFHLYASTTKIVSKNCINLWESDCSKTIIVGDCIPGIGRFFPWNIHKWQHFPSFFSPIQILWIAG